MIELLSYNHYWVIPGKFMAGEYPGDDYNSLKTEQRIDTLLEAGITVLIDLTEPNERVPYTEILKERAAYYQVDAEYLNFPITDFDIPSKEYMRTILIAIQRTLALSRVPYVHCWAGMGRTGTVVGCYLAESGLSGESALLKVDQLCHYAPSPQTSAQKNFVRNWR